MRNRTSSTQILSIQVLRALAAFAVASLHALNDASALAARAGGNFAVPAWPLAAGVDLFFVISGFVMVYASRDLFAQPGATGLFLRRRIARIVPLYWAATALFLAVGLALPQLLNTGRPALEQIIKSFLFIPYARPEDGLQQPIFSLGWTLNYEMFFYAVFSLALVWRARTAVALVTALFVVLVLLAPVLAPVGVPLAFWSRPVILEFVFGAIIGLAFLEGFRLPRLWGLALVMTGFLTLASGWPFSLAGETPQVLRWGLPCALMVAGAALSERAAGAETPLVRFLVTMGDASYALYLFHPFAMRALRQIFAAILDRLPAGIVQGAALPAFMALYLLLVLAAAGFLAYAIHRLFERPVTRGLQRHFAQPSLGG